MNPDQSIHNQLNQFLGLCTSVTRLGIDAQTVIALRLIRLAQGGRIASDETELMVFEKLSSFVVAQSELARDISAGRSADAAQNVVSMNHKKVRDNINRLS
eukprot:gene28406-31671_t